MGRCRYNGSGRRYAGIELRIACEIAAALELPLEAGIPGSYADLLERLPHSGGAGG